MRLYTVPLCREDNNTPIYMFFQEMRRIEALGAHLKLFHQRARFPLCLILQSEVFLSVLP